MYIEELSRTLEERYQEHLKAHSSVFVTSKHYWPHNNSENVTIIGMEGHNMARAIKEAINIRVNNPTLKNILASTTCYTFGIKLCQNLNNK